MCETKTLTGIRRVTFDRVSYIRGCCPFYQLAIKLLLVDRASLDSRQHAFFFRGLYLGICMMEVTSGHKITNENGDSIDLESFLMS